MATGPTLKSSVEPHSICPSPLQTSANYREVMRMYEVLKGQLTLHLQCKFQFKNELTSKEARIRQLRCVISAILEPSMPDHCRAILTEADRYYIIRLRTPPLLPRPSRLPCRQSFPSPTTLPAGPWKAYNGLKLACSKPEKPTILLSTL